MGQASNTWGGVKRMIFVTADWEMVEPGAGGSLLGGQCAGQLATGGTEFATVEFARHLSGQSGMVCVRERPAGVGC